KRLREMHKGMYEVSIEGVQKPELDVTDKAMIVSSMRQYANSRQYIEDLKVCIVKNNTKIDFITSDDPAILTNRFHIQKLGLNTFGVASSGTLFFLPLSPKHSLLCYDGNVYFAKNKKGYLINISNYRDIISLNEFQYIKAANN